MFIKQFTGLVLSVLVLANVCLTQEAVAQVTPRYKFKDGDELVYQTVVKFNQKQDISTGMKLENVSEQTDVTIRRFKEVDSNGDFLLEIENKTIAVKSKFGGAGEYHFNSKTGEKETGSALSPTLNSLYGTMAGAILEIKISPRGKVLTATGYKELMANVLKANPLAAQFTGGGSDEAYKMGLSEQFVTFDEKPVKIDDTWQTTFELNLPKLGKGVGKTVYTYVGNKKVDGQELMQISLTKELSFDADLKIGEATISGSFSTDESKGTALFDVEKGKLVSLESKLNLSGTLQVNVNGQNIQIEMKQTQSYKIDLLDKVPE